MNSFHLNKKSFIVTVIYAPFHLLATLSGAKFGVAGIAAGITIVKIVFINWNIKQVMDAVSIPVLRWYKEITPFFLVNICNAAIMIILVALFNISIHPINYIVLTVVSFLLVYILVFRIAYRKPIAEISEFMLTVSPKLSPYFNSIFKI